MVTRLEGGSKQANVSKQLGILYDAGLLGRVRAGNRVIYAMREPVIFGWCGSSAASSSAWPFGP